MNKAVMVMVALMATSVQTQAATEAPSSRTVTEQFKNWRYSCVEQDEQNRCEIGQGAANEQGQMVSQIIIGKNPEGKAQVQIVTPLLMDLKAGVKVKIDDAQSTDLSYLFCNQGACYVAELLDDDMVESMQAGNDMNIDLVAINGQTMTVNYSLSGFSSAFERLMD